ncbi:MAG: nuclear transport factor 2 family protein, partial [Caldilineaceae bacterium]|nr:nuclear transport factor 2 family protein [Caldilineaceae bacterium]
MKKYPILVFVLLLSLAPLAASAQASADPQDPAEIIQSIYAALEGGDVDGAMEMVAEDAVLTLIPPPLGTDGTFVGADAIRDWYDSLVANNIRIEFSHVDVSGNMASMSMATWVDDLPISPAFFDGSGIIQGGKLKALSWAMTPASMAALDAFAEKEATMALVASYFDDLWAQGNLDLADDLLAEDFVSHNFPAGDRAALKDAVAGFRVENPNAYFSYDDVVIGDGQVFIINRMMARPEGAAADAEG